MANVYLRAAIQGSSPGGEVWSVNPAFIGNFETNPPTQDWLESWATAIAALLPTGLGSYAAGALSSRFTIDRVRTELYGANGRLAAYSEAAPPTSAGGSGSLVHPVSTAVAVSLYTNIPGRRYRGRIYWPAAGLSLDSSTGRIAPSNTLGLAQDVAALLQDIEQAAPTGWEPVLGVYSRVLGAGVAVTQLRVGDVPDTQRRRRDALKETYATVPFS